MLRRDTTKRAKKRGLPYTLSEQEDFELRASPCHYCGAPAVFEGPLTPRTMGSWSGIDRIDSSKGYVRGNVLPCCAHHNNAKGARGYSEFIDSCISVVRHVGRTLFNLNVPAIA